MLEDRDRWNRKYSQRPPSKSVSSVVKDFYHLAPRDLALDLAAGGARNAIFLAEQGFQVHAVDISDLGFKGLGSGHPNLHPIVADLDQFNIPADTYSLIINVRFLNRRLFPYIIEGLAPGGILIFQTYQQNPDLQMKKGFCRDYLLRENELLRSFLPLQIRYYAESPADDLEEPGWVASLVAVKKK
jgi:tellurite methyltransferase